jgi:hypothetical protein
MIQFDAAPPVPLEYPRLTALTPEEKKQARASGYLGDMIDLRAPVRRAGLDNCTELRADDDIQDWRTRMYVIWFCYVYENFLLIDKPLYAVEELIMEFKAQSVLDTPDRSLGHLYAGTGGWEPTTLEREKELEFLKPHYTAAIALLDKWSARQSKRSPD